MKSKSIIGIVCMIIGIAIGVSIVIAKFQNPELTHTQMVMGYWKHYVMLLVFFGIGNVLLIWED